MQVLPSLVSGGVETGTIDIAKALVDKGHRAIVVSSGGQMVSFLDDIKATHITLPVHSKNPVVMWKNAQTLKQLIKQENIAVVHARSRAPAWSCYWATRSTNTPYITTFHGTYGHQGRLKKWYNSIMLKGNTTIAVSNFIAKHIHSIYFERIQGSTHKPEIQVIHRGIDISKFDPERLCPAKCEELRKRWEIHPSQTVVMLPGRITRWKGQAVFIEAIAKIKQEKITYLLVGDNKGKDHFVDELNALILKYNLQNQVKLVGGCKDMPTAYGISDIVVSASTDPEAFGRVACEAQAMKCLVVATRHGGSLETISPEQQNLLCNVSDCESLAEAIEIALNLCREENQERKNHILSSSRKHIEDKFTLELMCKDTLALYTKVVANQDEEFRKTCHDKIT